MQTFTTAAELKCWLRPHQAAGQTVGFVPTMGAFHEGHLTLMRRSKAENDLCVVSLFVNPTQFGSGEDLNRYPRDPARDSDLAESAGTDVLFAPSAEEIYPPGPAVTVHVADLSRRWEGERRPGHFEGVATVCAKLFTITRPDRAYFGRKDYQQLKIIQRLVESLLIPTEIVPCPTVREPDGLAMSSRNAYLTPDERSSAAALQRGLRAARAAFLDGERSSARLAAAVRRELHASHRITEDYIGIAHPDSLEPVETVIDAAVILLAARLGSTRLIDNQILDQSEFEASVSHA